MKKRILAMLLAAMMLMSATACSGREKPVEDEPEAPVEQPETPAEPEKPAEPEAPVEEEVKVEIPEQGEKIKEWVAINDDVIGWLHIPDTTINAPVVQYTDNDYYYRRNEKGEYKAYSTGCYWADYECKFGPKGEDMFPSTVIYGHNVDYGGTGVNLYSDNVGTDAPDEATGDRFSQLFHYTDMEWAKAHPYIYFSTPEEDMLWEVFSVGYTNDFSYITILKDRKVSKTEPITAGQLVNIANAQREYSLYDYNDVEVEGDDKILTLSTCTYKYGTRHDLRFIVMARLVTEEDTLVETANITENTDVKKVG